MDSTSSAVVIIFDEEHAKNVLQLCFENEELNLKLLESLPQEELAIIFGNRLGSVSDQGTNIIL
jgi:2-polyprenyl-6-methoxyphenol hydroxylase-like FAD-dependent oxidoreductase